MRSVIDFLIRLKQENEPKTIEQMRRMSSSIYKEFILECIENGYIVETSKTPSGVERYSLSRSADETVNDAKMHEKNHSNEKEQLGLNNNSSPVFLSIIIPVYNCEKYVSECLDSCIEQDLSYDEYEIICIDDGSTDKTPEILDMYAEKFNNIKVIHKRNCGVSSARNAGIQKAKGDYIWFVDADDFIGLNILAKLKNICAKSACDHLLFKGYYFLEKLSESEKQLYKFGKLFKDNEFRYEFCTHRLFRLKIIKDNAIRFLENVKFGEDQIFNFLFYKHSIVNNEIDFTFYYHRHHSASAMAKYFIDDYISSIISGAEFLREYAEKEIIYKKAQTIDYMLARISYAYKKISELSPFQPIKYLKWLSNIGYYPYKPPSDIKSHLKNKKFCTKWYYRKMRITYILNEKVYFGLCHPIKTFKRLAGYNND